CCRRQGGLHHQTAAPEWRLGKWDVHHRTRFLSKPRIADVSDHADNLASDIRIWRKSKLNLFADRILAGKIDVRQRLADNRHLERRLRILDSKQSPAQ